MIVKIYVGLSSSKVSFVATLNYIFCICQDDLLGLQTNLFINSVTPRYSVGQSKSKSDYFCNNFVCCQQTVVFGHNPPFRVHAPYETSYYSSQPKTLCVAALPCKILRMSLAMLEHVYYH